MNVPRLSLPLPPTSVSVNTTCSTATLQSPACLWPLREIFLAYGPFFIYLPLDFFFFFNDSDASSRSHAFFSARGKPYAKKTLVGQDSVDVPHKIHHKTHQSGDDYDH